VRTGRLLVRGVVAALLFATLGTAAALVFSPGLLAPVEGALEPVYRLVEGIETRRLLLIGALLIGVVAVLVVTIRKLSGGESPPRLVAEGERPPEATSVDPATVSGATADRAIADVASLKEARELREELRETAIDALGAAGEPPDDARERLERGDWTDDDLAAGFLGDAVPVPLLARLRGWLDESAEGRRRLIRSVDAVDELAAAPERTVDAATEETDE
jgi:hypothetical protein